MTASPAPADRLLVAAGPDAAVVRVVGRGSFHIGPALKEFAADAIDRGASELAVDTRDCIGMDSTFMGVLAGLSMRLQRERGRRVVLLNVSAKNRGLLSTLGLDRVVEAHDAGDTPPRLAALLPADADLGSLPGGTASPTRTAETMLRAHEDLVAAAPANRPKFKDVIDYLREDVHKHRKERRDSA